MTRLQRLALLQWAGVVLAPAAWVGQHAVGQGTADARCSPGGSQWGIGHDTWQIALMVATVIVILVSEAAAIAVYRATRESSYQSPPPAGRLQFFAIPAMVANLIFLGIVLMDGVASVVDALCRQS